jgi:very-short-patch-repair endonuclease
MALRLITIDELKQYLLKHTEVELISDKITSSTEKLIFKCKCGEHYSTSWHKIKTQNKILCNDCSKKNRIEKERIITEEIIKNRLVLDGNKLISKYINNREKIEIECSCGKSFTTTYGSYCNTKHGKTKCSECSQSFKIHEENVKDILKIKNITYEREKQFDDLKNIRHLRFDFFLKDYNTCIEVDEKYHKSTKGLKEYAVNDTLKMEYCRKNNFNLIRITDKVTFMEIMKIIDDIVYSHLKD